jgi:hypothetical protein
MATGFAIFCVASTSLVLALASLSKILRPIPFYRAVRDYQIVPKRLLPFVVVLIPVIESTMVIAIIRFEHSWIAAGACAGLFLSFAVGMSVNLLRGRTHISCGCGILGKNTISWRLVFRNIALAGIAFGATSNGIKVATASIIVAVVGAIFSNKLAAWVSPVQATS